MPPASGQIQVSCPPCCVGATPCLCPPTCGFNNQYQFTVQFFSNQNCPGNCCTAYNRHVILNYEGGYGTCAWTEDPNTGGNICCGAGCVTNVKGFWTLKYVPHYAYIPGCGFPGFIAGPQGTCNQDAFVLTFTCGLTELYKYVWTVPGGHACLANVAGGITWRYIGPAISTLPCGVPLINFGDFGPYPSGTNSVPCPKNSPCATCPLPGDKPTTLYCNVNWECLFFGGATPFFNCNCNYVTTSPQNIILTYNQATNCYQGTGTTPAPCGFHVTITFCCTTNVITFSFADCNFHGLGSGPSSQSYTLSNYSVFCEESFYLQVPVTLSLGAFQTSCCPFLNAVCVGPNLQEWIFWFNLTD
jgi:hypothetical protein